MKALSLTQPWATLIAIGAKRVETRSWSTNFRGRLAIHASKAYPTWARETCAEEPFYSLLQAHGQQWIRDHAGQSPRAVFEDPVLPLGMIIAVATVDGVLPTVFANVSDREQAFGDYADGRYAWFLTDVRKLPIPIPCKGALGLWDVPTSVYAAIAPQLVMTASEA